MRVGFVVFFSIFQYLAKSQEIGWEERLQNDLFCVGWDVKPYSMIITCVLILADRDHPG